MNFASLFESVFYISASVYIGVNLFLYYKASKIWKLTGIDIVGIAAAIAPPGKASHINRLQAEINRNYEKMAAVLPAKDLTDDKLDHLVADSTIELVRREKISIEDQRALLQDLGTEKLQVLVKIFEKKEAYNLAAIATSILNKQ